MKEADTLGSLRTEHARSLLALLTKKEAYGLG